MAPSTSSSSTRTSSRFLGPKVASGIEEDVDVLYFGSDEDDSERCDLGVRLPGARVLGR